MENKTTSIPKVSVIVPVYNYEKYLEQCITGILEQKINFPIEVIIGDDASTDNSRDVILNTINKNQDELKTFKTLFHKQNLGPKEFPGKNNWLSCINETNGEYIAICDGDDYWTDSNKLQMQVDFLEKNKHCSGVFHPADWYIEKTGKLIQRRYKPKHIRKEYYFKDYFLEEGSPVPTASLVCRNFKSTLPEIYKQAFFGDLIIHMSNIQRGPYGYIDKSMAVYREHSEGEHSKYDKHNNLLKEVTAYHLAEKEFPISEMKEFRKVLFSKYLKVYAISRKNNLEDKRQILLKALKYATIKDLRSIIRDVFPRVWNLYIKFKYYFERMMYYITKSFQ